MRYLVSVVTQGVTKYVVREDEPGEYVLGKDIKGAKDFKSFKEAEKVCELLDFLDGKVVVDGIECASCLCARCSNYRWTCHRCMNCADGDLKVGTCYRHDVKEEATV